MTSNRVRSTGAAFAVGAIGSSITG
jgi:hypothetical protein